MCPLSLTGLREISLGYIFEKRCPHIYYNIATNEKSLKYIHRNKYAQYEQ